MLKQTECTGIPDVHASHSEANANALSHAPIIVYLKHKADLPPSHCPAGPRLDARCAAAGCIPVFVGPPFHAMPFARHVDYAASSVFINLTDTRKWFGKERAQWHLNPRTQNKHKGKDGGPRFTPSGVNPGMCSAACAFVWQGLGCCATSSPWL